MCKILLTLLAIIAPPFAVLFQEGCTCNFLINALLTLLGILPGTIHAWYILWCYERPTSPHTTVYIQGQPAAPISNNITVYPQGEPVPPPHSNYLTI